MRTEANGDAWPSEAFGLAGGCATVVLAALATAAFVAPGHVVARAAVMAVVVGVLAAVLARFRACAGAAVLAALIYIGFLVHRDGVLTGDTSAWTYTIMIGLAGVLGRGGRWIWRTEESRAPVTVPARSATSGRAPSRGSG